MELALSIILFITLCIAGVYLVFVLLNLPHYTTSVMERLDKDGNTTSMNQKEYSEGLYTKALYYVVGGALLKFVAVAIAVMTLLYLLNH